MCFLAAAARHQTNPLRPVRIKPQRLLRRFLHMLTLACTRHEVHKPTLSRLSHALPVAAL